MKAAIYARVSTSDKEQDPARQTDKIKQFCAAMGWEVTHIIIDEESGRKVRKGVKQLLELARVRDIDVVVVWKFDRFTREGAHAALDYLKQLSGYGVKFKSMTEPFLDSTGSFGEQVLIPLFAWMAHQTSEKISDDVSSGIDRKKSKGDYYKGRPSYNLTEEQALQFLEVRYSTQPPLAFRKAITEFYEKTGIKLSLGFVHKIGENPENYIKTEELLKKAKNLVVHKRSYEQGGGA